MKKEMTRREMLLFSSAATATTLMGRNARAVTNAEYIPRFQLPLPVPPILQPVGTDAHTDFYEITQREAQVNILPGKFTTIWGYDGLFPGPTIKAKRDRSVVIRYTNRLTVPTSVHLHGASTASESLGNAHLRQRNTGKSRSLCRLIRRLLQAEST
jgi:spore coat protein A